MLNFRCYMPTVIHFGKTKIEALKDELSSRAKNVLLVTGRGSIKRYGIFQKIMNEIKASGVAYYELSGIQPNPRLKSVYEGIEICKRDSIDFVLAVGGGSVIDAAKAIAVGAVNDGDVWDFFRTHTGPCKALPIGTVLTVSATGSEMNGNAVITKEETKEKRATSSPVMIPQFSILNPEFTTTVDAFNTAAGIADIMAHIFESYLSPIPFSDVQDRLAEGLLKVCIDNGPVVCTDPDNYDARANIMWASTLALNGTIGKGKISDWICHAIEHEISGIYDISHGAGLAIIIPNLMKVFLSDETIGNFVQYGVNVWNIDQGKDQYAIAGDAIAQTREFFNSLELPETLSEIGITDKYFEEIATNALKCRGDVGHFRQLDKKQVLEILKLSL